MQKRLPGTTLMRDTKKFEQVSGSQPAIAISENNIVVVVYREKSSDLQFIIGVMDIHRNINWGRKDKYTDGINPSVSINAQGVVVEAHQSNNFRRLFHRAGAVDTQQRNITWYQTSGRGYTLGRNPVIYISNEYLVEAHQTNSYAWNDGIFYSLGKLHQSDNPSINPPEDNSVPTGEGPVDPNDIPLQNLRGDNEDSTRPNGSDLT